jgi:SAM-dependent methyltransferase
MTQEVLFDRKLLRQNMARAASNFSNHNFLYVEVANRIAENVQFLNHKFESVLEIGGRDTCLTDLIRSSQNPKTIIQTKLFSPLNFDQEKEELKCIVDDEFLPFKNESFDLVLTNLNLHYINQIPQFLLQVKSISKPNGVFIASFFGEENLSQLAHVLYQTENEIYGGISPRMPPTIDVKTAANLIAKAGFKNPISDFAKIEVNYSNPLNLLKDLKMMGQGNILTKRSRKFLTREFLNKISENYQKLYGDKDGNVTATFEVITVTGWA